VSALPDLTPGGRIGRITVRGNTPAPLSDATTSGSLSLSISEVSTLTLTVLDPDLTILRSGVLHVGAPLSYAGVLAFTVAVMEINASGPGGVPALSIEARDAGAQKARAEKGELVRAHVSPSQYVAVGAAAVGLRVVAEPSPVRASITRAGPQQGQPGESEYDVWQRLATEIGYICFVSAGVVYFAQPTWLIDRQPKVPVDWRGNPAVLGLPACRRSADDPTQPCTITAPVADSLALELIPGGTLKLLSVPTFTAEYLVTQLDLPLADAVPATVTACTPVDPAPQPPQAATAGPGGLDSLGFGAGPGFPLSLTAPSALLFVTQALTQTGHGSVGGSFDGAELVAWAGARVGVALSRSPAGLYGDCAEFEGLVDVGRAQSIRGALLFNRSPATAGPPHLRIPGVGDDAGGGTFVPGQVAISLGDGRCIAAVGGAYRVESSGGWSRGGLLPELSYSASGVIRAQGKTPEGGLAGKLNRLPF